MDITSLPRVGPYVGVSEDIKIAFEDLPGRTFRILIYGAYDALGLIGCERNGIAILDNDKLEVVCDEIEKISSGWSGPTREQVNKFKEICGMDWIEFRQVINRNSRSRHEYDEEGEILAS